MSGQGSVDGGGDDGGGDDGGGDEEMGIRTHLGFLPSSLGAFEKQKR